MGWELGETARARGIGLLALEEVDSTNEEGKRLAAAGERGPLWIAARRQSKGRGRLGREWVSREGNLHASLIYSDCPDPAKAPQLGFVAGLAAISAVKDVTGLGDRIALKWPNDLLLDGGKLGGILLEGVSVATGDERQPDRMVTIIGIGVNCAFAPEGLPYPARALKDVLPRAPSAEELLARLSDSFAATLDLWSGRDGFAAVREKWLQEAAGVGHAIRVNCARGVELRGRFKTIDAFGRLVVATGQGDEIVDAGDVFFGEAGSFRPSNGIA
ncbi:biotin--[acetyl-CoA-carboxylase] ligase [Methylocystis heyeri]|uniref:biotin--[biotin carboxyl-carrier protein] ligase n=1 Tax=Methylocystis heyeri TaxID=391905 RepID=A0A6B8KBY4_9HYPH|nr:biotin--[acetyl-CoA-carboxylase] ligase [Methylocystis heyeri]QGM45209.1 biotin--[acetyl-CoA-carboxylase] ligase [Methylocystis heyeri]